MIQHVLQCLLARFYHGMWHVPDLPEFDVRDWFSAEQLAEYEAERDALDPGELL